MGTGTGQAAVPLTKYFKNVIGFDPSAGQLANAVESMCGERRGWKRMEEGARVRKGEPRIERALIFIIYFIFSIKSEVFASSSRED